MPAWLLPAILGVTGLAGSILQNKAAGKAAEEQAKLYNDWLRLRQQGVNDILAATQARGYDPFGPQVSTREDKSQSTTSQSTQQHTTQAPTITPKYAALEGRLRSLLQERLSGPSALPAGYAQAGLRNINRTAEPGLTAERNFAARRNLPFTAVGSPAERARAGAAADFLTQLPLQERALRNEDLNAASGAISSFGRGSQTDMFGNSVTNQNQSGTSKMTTPPNLGALANLILPEGPQASGASGRSMGGDLLSGLSQLYFSNPSYFNSLFGGGTKPTYTSGGAWSLPSNTPIYAPQLQ